MIRRKAPGNAARQILARYPEHVSNFFVDIKAIIESHEIEIDYIVLPDEISGLIHVDEKENARIVVNEDHHPNRQRFTMAHELGHYILHKNKGIHIDKKSFSRNRNAISQTGLDPIEIEANRFAAELLMPKELIEKKLTGKEDLIDLEEDVIYNLAKKFKVSTAAMSIRLQSLGYLPQEF